MKKFILTLAAAITTVLTVSTATFAAPSGLYLDPLNGSVEKDATFSVQLRLNAGSNSGVQANLEFDPSKMQAQSSSNQGSALDNVTVTRDNSAGRISIYSVSGSDSGDRLITTITFRATNPGTAPLNFVGNNSTLRYALLVPIWSSASTTSATYSITAPGGVPAPGGGGNTTTPVTPSTPNSGTANPRTSPRSTTTPGGTPTPTNPEQQTAAEPDAIAEETQTPDSQFNAGPEFKTTPPDTEPWEPYTATVPTSVLLVPWLPIIAVAAALVVIGGTYATYRQTHMSQSLRRLLATIAANTAAPAGATTPKLLTGTILPALKLLAYTQPKLLASGIKQKLLGTGKNTSDKD